LIPPDALYNPKPSTQGSYSLDAQIEGYIKLICFLEKIQAPIKAFDELMQLLTELDTNRFNFSCHHKKRRSVLETITKIFPTAKTECIPVELESPEPK
jgi:hypothetical protein